MVGSAMISTYMLANQRGSGVSRTAANGPRITPKRQTVAQSILRKFPRLKWLWNQRVQPLKGSMTACGNPMLPQQATLATLEMGV
jgi:hypothetical protein